MPTETLVLLFLRGSHEPERVTLPADEDWELRDTERLVLVLDGRRRVLAAVNLQDFVKARVAVGDDAE